MAGPHLSNGVTLGVGDGASPEGFTTVTQLLGHVGPTVEKSTYDVTALAATTRTKLPGKKRVRTVQIDGMYAESGGSPVNSNGATITIAGTAIALVTSISGAGEEAPVIDVTTLAGTTGEILRGIEGGGVLDVEALLKPDDNSGQDVVLDGIDGTASQAIVITLANSDTIQFSAFVTMYEPAVRLDDAIRLKLRLEVTGAVTWPSLATGQAALITSLQAGTEKNYKITLTDTAGTITFSAYVVSAFVTIGVDTPVGISFVLAIDGEATHSYQ